MLSVNAQSSRPVVLVVEDEYLVRLYAADVIADAGFDVIQANNADEAIAFLEARKDIAVVFTDIDMPGSMDGLKLAAAVRNRWPPIELILTSGKYNPGDQGIPERGHFLPKPYHANSLARAVRNLAAA
jgi:CheY-like chemotaxis protein